MGGLREWWSDLDSYEKLIACLGAAFVLNAMASVYLAGTERARAG